MSLQSKKGEENAGGSGFNQKRRNADRVRERYQKHTIENLIRQAEYKNSLGMELTGEERFVLENKGFLLRKRKMMSKDE